MTTATLIDAPRERQLKGWHVLLIMLAFFGVMFTVNGFFLYSAITSFPGEDVEKSYLQGLNYNQTLEARRAQAELGWTERAGLSGLEAVAVQVADADGAPVGGLSVEAKLRRLTTGAQDVTVALAAAGTPGLYRADLPELESGQWEMIVTATDMSGDVTIEARKDVRVP